MSDPHVCTTSGIMFNLAEPTPEMVSIRDIAYALSRIVRFNGHGDSISVAQHSVMVHDDLYTNHGAGAGIALLGLLHDAHEAYTGDLPTPLKGLLPGVHEVQERIQDAIHERVFGEPYQVSMAARAMIKDSDIRSLKSEAYRMFPPHEVDKWEVARETENWESIPVQRPLVPRSPRMASIAFLSRFHSSYREAFEKGWRDD